MHFLCPFGSFYLLLVAIGQLMNDRVAACVVGDWLPCGMIQSAAFRHKFTKFTRGQVNETEEFGHFDFVTKIINVRLEISSDLFCFGSRGLWMVISDLGCHWRQHDCAVS